MVGLKTYMKEQKHTSASKLKIYRTIASIPPCPSPMKARVGTIRRNDRTTV